MGRVGRDAGVRFWTNPGERDEDKLVVTVHNDINGTSSNWVLTRRSATWNGFAVAARRAIRREDFVFLLSMRMCGFGQH